MKKIFKIFSVGDIIVWSLSVAAIITAFCVFDKSDYLKLASSLIGVTSLIFAAQGNPFGQILTITFSVLYGIISYSYAYYGEMITYLGMTAPMAAVALIAWLKHPYNGKRSEVKIKAITRKDVVIMSVLTVAVTVAFYFILSALNTANIIPSTISVATSFSAVFLSAKRSPYYALAYMLNDVVLIVLWTLAAMEDMSYLSVIICFVAFLFNDIYGFICWQKRKKRQEAQDFEQTH